MFKKIFLVSFLIVILLGIAGCAKKKSMSTNNNSSPVVEKILEPSEKTQIPNNLSNCNTKFFALDDKNNYPQDCATYEQNTVCVYYQETDSNGTVKNKVLPYNNECYACRFYGEDKEVKIGGNKTHRMLGFSRGACPQGSY